MKRLADTLADLLEILALVLGYGLAALGAAVAFSWLLSL